MGKHETSRKCAWLVDSTADLILGDRVVDWVRVGEVVDAEHLEDSACVGGVGATHKLRILQVRLYPVHHLLALLLCAVLVVVAGEGAVRKEVSNKTWKNLTTHQQQGFALVAPTAEFLRCLQQRPAGQLECKRSKVNPLNGKEETSGLMPLAILTCL